MLPRAFTLGIVLGFVLACSGGGSTAPTAAPAPAPPEPPAAPAGAAPAPVAAPVAPPPAASAAARPLYYDRLITEADLDGRTLRELSLMRNTIFARAGNPFVKPWLDAYFRAQPWYRPSDRQDLSKLTPVDHRNVEIIAARERSIPREVLLAERSTLVGRATLSPEDRIELRLLSEALGEWSGGEDVPLSERNPLEDPRLLDGQLTVDMIDGMSRRDLRLLRNTIYARHGRPFKSPVLQAYFAEKAWYTPNDAFTEAMLTEVDKRNIKLVQSMEDRLGGPMKEWEAQKEEGWFDGA
jgi:hypothetical protein